MSASFVGMRPAGYEDDCELDDLSFVDAELNNHQDASGSGDTGNKKKRRARFGKNLPKLQTEDDGKTETPVRCAPKVITSSGSPACIKSIDDFKMAVMRNDLKKVNECLEQGIPADTVFNTSWTALMYAANFGKPEMVKLLLEKGADPNYNKDSLTVLMVACSSSCQNEADVLNCVTLLLDHKAEANACDRSSVTPLHKAVCKGRVNVVRKLLEAGADIDRQDDNGCTALTRAVKQNDIQMIKLLLEAGADCSKKTVLGEKALDLANFNGFTEAESLLKANQKQCLANGVQASREVAQSSPVSDNRQHFCGSSQSVRDQTAFTTERDKSQSWEPYEYGELEIFLMGLDLADLIPKFYHHGILFTDFLQMSDKDLQQLGITQYNIRKKILDAIQDTHKMDWQTSSINVIPYNKAVTCADAIAMVKNIKKHAALMSSTIGYITDQIKTKPEVLAQAEDHLSSDELSIQSEEAITNVRYLYEELVLLRNFLTEVPDKSLYQPASLYRPIPQNKDGPSWFSAKTVLLGAAICGVLYYNREVAYKYFTSVSDKLALLRR